MELGERLKEDFREFKDSCLAIILYGSYARGEQTRRSDIDVCLVNPDQGVYKGVLSSVGGKYDVKVFEDLPLYVQINIIESHQVIYGDHLELSEYFYRYRKIWRDMKHRIEENQFHSIEEKIALRRRAHEKTEILR